MGIGRLAPVGAGSPIGPGPECSSCSVEKAPIDGIVWTALEGDCIADDFTFAALALRLYKA
jgi:hypothetical protein